MDFLQRLAVAFIVLKLTGFIDWSWFWVVSLLVLVVMIVIIEFVLYKWYD